MYVHSLYDRAIRDSRFCHKQKKNDRPNTNLLLEVWIWLRTFWQWERLSGDRKNSLRSKNLSKKRIFKIDAQQAGIPDNYVSDSNNESFQGQALSENEAKLSISS